MNEATIEKQFERFHKDNPHVLEHLERLARQWLAAGHDSLGIGMLWEVLRWQTGITTKGDPFRLNNNYRSRYVRLMIERNPSWDECFQTRSLRAA